MKSAEQNIISFLKENPSKWSAAQLQRMEFKNRRGTLASPKAISRRLQENAEAGGLLEVSYDEHNTAHYQIKAGHEKKEEVFYIKHPFEDRMITTKEYALL